MATGESRKPLQAGEIEVAGVRMPREQYEARRAAEKVTPQQAQQREEAFLGVARAMEPRFRELIAEVQDLALPESQRRGMESDIDKALQNAIAQIKSGYTYPRFEVALAQAAATFRGGATQSMTDVIDNDDPIRRMIDEIASAFESMGR